MSRGPRFVGQVALLPLLWLISYDVTLFTFVVGVALLVVWPVAIAVAWILVWLARDTERRGREVPATMLEAADNAVTDALEATGLAAAAMLAILNALHVIDLSAILPVRPVLILLGWSLILHGFPPISWMRTLRSVWLPRLRP